MKTLGGLGYILTIIPFLNFVAPILVGIAWFQMGGRTNQSLFRATGVLYLVTFVAAIAVVAAFASVLIPMMFTLFSLGERAPLDEVLSILPAAAALGALTLGVGVLGFATFIVELVSHFRASRIFASKWFRRAAWMRILAIVLALVFVAAVTFGALLIPELFFGLGDSASAGFLGSVLLLLLLPVIVVGLLGPIFSAIAFFTLRELPPPPPDI
ncbi:MAG: hypothetical protein NZ570_06230 [Candidatus Caldarchaeum sp.]|nr:hypothetical protein [Candidatus Caldarchaeum sp.]MCS7137854.1 hypothetical protein [Candidatus Caldarchaeum sp.]MDW7978344.1 hypothetical protein [Candidatus Caldarchaeum sp.]MDW8359367.1 hypothetical protein [Candidatus Caldarchaeum sp.]